MTRILIAASGTGGHLFPALAVAEKLSDCDIQWLGVSDRLETSLVPKTYPLHTVTAKGLQGNPVRKVLNGLQLLRSVFQTKQLLSQQKIDLIFTTGGYIAAPAILAAKWQGIPVILHESNVLPGKVTRFIGKYADTVLIGFADAAQHLPEANTLHLGTPVREDFLAALFGPKRKPAKKHAKKRVPKRSKLERQMDKMEKLNLNAAGLDIGSEEIYVAVPQERDDEPVRCFKTFIQDLNLLADWLEACKAVVS